MARAILDEHVAATQRHLCSIVLLEHDLTRDDHADVDGVGLHQPGFRIGIASYTGAEGAVGSRAVERRRWIVARRELYDLDTKPALVRGKRSRLEPRQSRL